MNVDDPLVPPPDRSHAGSPLPSPRSRRPSPPPLGVTLDTIGALAEASERVIESLHAYPEEVGGAASAPPRRYTISEVARLIGRSPEGIRKAERQGRLAMPERRANGRHEPYTLAQINAMRELWELFPGRRPGDAPVRMAFTNFKGGVGKTTLSVHCAQYFARAGYRVLLVDCDSQASATMTFGYRPDLDIDADDTLLGYLEGAREDLAYAVRRTRWDGLDLIPANLELYSAEYHLAAKQRNDEEGWISRLDRGLAMVENDYDIVLIDPPPALGMISLSVLRAIDGVLIPAPPAMYDFHSTSAFLRMLEEVMETVGAHLGRPVELDFMKLVVSKHVRGKPAHDFVANTMAECFGTHVLLNAFVQSAEIDNATAAWKTVYDLEGPTASSKTYRRCVESLDAVFGEIETLVQAVWQSRRSRSTLSGTSEPRVPPSGATAPPREAPAPAAEPA